MITGKELKMMAGLVPDDAVVTIDGNNGVDVVRVVVENMPWGVRADLRLTEGWSITNDAKLSEIMRMFRHAGSTIPDAETR